MGVNANLPIQKKERSMMIKTTTPRQSRGLLSVGVMTASALLLGACAGGVSAGGNEGGGDGYALGAPDEERAAALEELEPMTLTFQPSGQSEKSNVAISATMFADEVEKLSNGKITVDIVWAQAIAPYTEVNDALADGRLDIAFSIPAYDPQSFSAINDLGTLLAEAPQSPNLGVATANSAAVDVAWNSATVLEQYEAQGLVPIQPVIASAHYYPTCNSADSFDNGLEGEQVRTASSAQTSQLQELGAAPVSMEYVEAFEALQRGTIDCALNQLPASLESGLFEVAPHIEYAVEDGGYAMSPSAVLAGKSFTEMPLAYQQVIFDAWPAMFAGNLISLTSGSASAVGAIKEAGGSISQMNETTERELTNSSSAMVEEADEAARLGDSPREAVSEATNRWQDEAEPLGIVDGGTLEDMDSWYDEDQPFRELGDALYKDVVSAHRPE